MSALLQLEPSTAETVKQQKDIAYANISSFYSQSLSYSLDNDYGDFLLEIEVSYYADPNKKWFTNSEIKYKLLKKPLRLEIRYLDTQKAYVAYSPYLNLSITSQEMNDLVGDFLNLAISDYNDYLNTTKENLTIDALELLDKYNDVFGEGFVSPR